MATVMHSVGPAQGTVVLHDVSWETYERLLDEQQENGSVQFSYDRGTLEIMILSLRHERLKHIIATLVELLADELAIDVEGTGSTTFRRQESARGFEPDASFYFRHAEQIRAKQTIDLALDPPPELVIKVDISHGSLDKLPIFAGLGVFEAWRYTGNTMTIYRLTETGYSEQTTSALLPGISAVQLSEWIQAGETLKRSDWLRLIRDKMHAGR